VIYTVSFGGRIGLRPTKSSEYSIAGGVRKSQRKRPARKAIDKSTDAAA
jgi:hypothetical protein